MPLYGQNGYGSGKYGIADNGPIYKLPMQYYLSLFSSEYQNSAKWLEWVRKDWQPFDDLTDLMSIMSGYFNVQTAIGVQLDTIGAIVGASRTLPFQPSNGVSPVLEDDTYRQLLLATIGINHWSSKLVDIYRIWKNVFPQGKLVINDNQNMTCTVIVSGSFSSIVLDMITHGFIIPRPEGVLYTYETTTLPIFGADLNTAYVAGADIGHAA
jgi:hypothetical protein